MIGGFLQGLPPLVVVLVALHAFVAVVGVITLIVYTIASTF